MYNVRFVAYLGEKCHQRSAAEAAIKHLFVSSPANWAEKRASFIGGFALSRLLAIVQSGSLLIFVPIYPSRIT